MSVRRLLVECVKDHDWSLPPAAPPELLKNGIPARLVPTAMAHRVTGCAYRSLSTLVRPDDQALRQLEEGYRRSAASHLRALADVRAAGSVLDAVGIPWLVVKGRSWLAPIIPTRGSGLTLTWISWLKRAISAGPSTPWKKAAAPSSSTSGIPATGACQWR